ncbi:MAG: hypothetical protein AUK63_1512 [bacterium P3]|nr:MAG: hypothetical protein AUK63_1512 [bacterium P3]KWW41092.1 MAG: hypothetical protein F083_1259 [bacterium F083]
MKTMAKIFGGIMLALAAVSVCGVCVSCASSDGAVMHQKSHKKSKVIKSNYKVKGDNRSNSRTYHAY